MSILYIGSNDVCITDDKFTKILYYAKKGNIKYDQLMHALPKRNLKVFINSFFAFSEHRQIALGISQKEIKQIINDRMLKKDVVCASYNHLFLKGNGGERANDVVFSIVKVDESEQHIQKILNRLTETDINLKHIYSFGQAIHTIGLSYSNIEKKININIMVMNNALLITVSHTTHYMFGRLMQMNAEGDLSQHIGRLLATTIKYINTTYTFLKEPIKVAIMSNEVVDTQLISNIDPILENISFTTPRLKLPALSIVGKVPDISNELQLLSLALPNISHVNLLTNTSIENQRKTHKLITFFSFFSILCLLGAIGFCASKIMSSAILNKEDIKVEKEYNKINRDYSKYEKLLNDMENNIYIATATAIANIDTNNNHIDTMKDIASVLRKYKNALYIEGYSIQCDNCSANKRERRYRFTADIALYNVNESIKYTILKLAEIERDIISTLKKQYKNVSVEFVNISKNKRHAGAKDVRDIMIVSFGD